jgi:hypothetical protein
MALYNRLLSTPANGEAKIQCHQFLAIVREFRRGTMTSQQAQDAVTYLSGMPLTASEITDLTNLFATVPTGSTTTNRLDRLDRVLVIEDTLILADAMVPGYTTDALLRTKLGVA